jgi:hypothetical protein
MIQVKNCGIYQVRENYEKNVIPKFLNSNINRIFLTCKIKNIPQNTTVVSQWYYFVNDDKKMFILKYPLKIAANYNGYLTFYVEIPPEKELPVGKYEVILKNKGLVLKDLIFNVK